MTDEERPSSTRCAARVELTSLEGVPIVRPGDDVGSLLVEACEASGLRLADGDVLVVTSKLLSRAEGRFVDLAGVTPGAEAVAVADRIDKDPRMVELILRESESVSREAPGILVVRHRLGFVSANAAIDASNAAPPDAPAGSGPWALLISEDPDGGAERIRATVKARTGAEVGVVISDSLGRPFRLGTVGAAIGVAGLPPLTDHRGRTDLFGRVLEHSEAALADQLAAAGDLMAGQADEARPITHVRGLTFAPGAHSARELVRPAEEGLYA